MLLHHHVGSFEGSGSIVPSLISLVIPVLVPRPTFLTFLFLLLKLWLRSSRYSRWASMRSHCSPCLMYRTSSVMLLCWFNGSMTESNSWKNSTGRWARNTVTEGYTIWETWIEFGCFFLMVLWASRGKVSHSFRPPGLQHFAHTTVCQLSVGVHFRQLKSFNLELYDSGSMIVSLTCY